MAIDDDVLAGGSVLAGVGNMAFPGLGTLISAGTMIAGFGLKTAGTINSVNASRQYASTENALAGQKNQATQKTIQDQMAIEQVRRQAMELSAHRMQMENLRSAQRQASYGTAAAANQGAQSGSGLSGGLAQIRGYEGWNAVGVNQQLGMGENVFDLNRDISGNKITLANLDYQSQVAKNNYQSSSSTASGMGSLGSSIMGMAGPLGKLFSGPNPSGL